MPSHSSSRKTASPRQVETKILGSADGALFRRVAPDLFDHPVKAGLVHEFLNDPRHHIAVAVDRGTMVGFVSALHYVHPDKDPELWINEVSASRAYLRRGLARELIGMIFEVGRGHGCGTAWVGTSRTNTAAMRLYRSAGEGRAELEDFVMFTFPLATERKAKSKDSSRTRGTRRGLPRTLIRQTTKI